MANIVEVHRRCPACNQPVVLRLDDHAVSMVVCEHCNARYEIDMARYGKAKRAAVGAPTNPKATFKYHSAASHADVSAFRRRVLAYAKLRPWGPPCAN
jgi:hypothetical protein